MLGALAPQRRPAASTNSQKLTGLRRERALHLVGEVGIREESPEDWALEIAGLTFAGMSQSGGTSLGKKSDSTEHAWKIANYLDG